MHHSPLLLLDPERLLDYSRNLQTKAHRPICLAKPFHLARKAISSIKKYYICKKFMDLVQSSISENSHFA